MSAIMQNAIDFMAGLFRVGGEGQEPGMVITFFTWLTSEPVLPYFIISLGVTLTLLAVRIVRSVFYGT